MSNNNPIEDKKIETTDNQESKELFEVLDFNSLVTIKGKPGIYTVVGNTNKGGMVATYRWKHIFTNQENLQTASFKEDRVKPIDSFNCVYTEEKVNKESDSSITVSRVLPLAKVFNNLYNYESSFDDLGIEDFNLNNENTLLNLMDIAVPNYDPTIFKGYHLKKLINIYKEAKEVLLLSSEEAKNQKKSNENSVK